MKVKLELSVRPIHQFAIHTALQHIIAFDNQNSHCQSETLKTYAYLLNGPGVKVNNFSTITFGDESFPQIWPEVDPRSV